MNSRKTSLFTTLSISFLALLFVIITVLILYPPYIDGGDSNQYTDSGETEIDLDKLVTFSYLEQIQAPDLSYENIATPEAVPTNGKTIYLTFDDGPGPYTEQLLDALDKYNVKVTFFVTNQSPSYQNLIGEAHKRGHTIALHTYSHVFKNIYSSTSAYYADLEKIADLCVAQTGTRPSIIRFPGGTSNVVSRHYSKGIMAKISKGVEKKGYQYCDWNVDSNDAGGATSATEIFQNVTAGVSQKTNSYVLMHDTKRQTLEAIEDIIRWGLSNGYQFKAMDSNTTMFHHPVRN